MKKLLSLMTTLVLALTLVLTGGGDIHTLLAADAAALALLTTA